jgi:hypothetical protein
VVAWGWQLRCGRWWRGSRGRWRSEDGRGSIGGRGVRRGVRGLLDERLTESDAAPKVVKSVGIGGVALGRRLSGGVAKVNGHPVEEVVETV